MGCCISRDSYNSSTSIERPKIQKLLKLLKDTDIMQFTQVVKLINMAYTDSWLDNLYIYIKKCILTGLFFMLMKDTIIKNNKVIPQFQKLVIYNNRQSLQLQPPTLTLPTHSSPRLAHRASPKASPKSSPKKQHNKAQNNTTPLNTTQQNIQDILDSLHIPQESTKKTTSIDVETISILSQYVMNIGMPYFIGEIIRLQSLTERENTDIEVLMYNSHMYYATLLNKMVTKYREMDLDNSLLYNFDNIKVLENKLENLIETTLLV